MTFRKVDDLSIICVSPRRLSLSSLYPCKSSRHLSPWIQAKETGSASNLKPTGPLVTSFAHHQARNIDSVKRWVWMVRLLFLVVGMRYQMASCKAGAAKPEMKQSTDQGGNTNQKLCHLATKTRPGHVRSSTFHMAWSTNAMRFPSHDIFLRLMRPILSMSSFTSI